MDGWFVIFNELLCYFHTLVMRLEKYMASNVPEQQTNQYKIMNNTNKRTLCTSICN